MLKGILGRAPTYSATRRSLRPQLRDAKCQIPGRLPNLESEEARTGLLFLKDNGRLNIRPPA